MKLGDTVPQRNERLVKLLNGIAEMKLGPIEDHDIEIFRPKMI